MIDKIFNLRTENLIEPIGIDARVPLAGGAFRQRRGTEGL